MGNHKQKLRYLVAVAWLGWLLPVVAAALAGQDPFAVEVTVPDRLAASREAVTGPALEEVLTRVAGTASVLQTAQAAGLLENPGRYVQQYRYFTVPGSQPPELKLWMRFDEESVRASLQQQAVPRQASEPPETLVWLAVEDGVTRYLVPADDDSAVRRQFQQAAQQRGVRVLFPLLDLLDQTRVRFADIQDGLYDRVLDASSRYNTQAVLIGKLERAASGEWMARWHIALDGQSGSWSASAPGLERILLLGMDETADRLASRSVVAGHDNGITAVSITVQGVNNLAAYARISEYVGTLTSVVSARLERAEAAEVGFLLQLNGNLQDLNRTISIGSVLEPLPGGMPGNYRLRQ